MLKIARKSMSLALVAVFAASMGLWGCSSSPNEAEMKQLADLREETSRLEKEIADKEKAKSSLESAVAEKNSKLKKCNDDQQVVKQRLGQ